MFPWLSHSHRILPVMAKALDSRRNPNWVEEEGQTGLALFCWVLTARHSAYVLTAWRPPRDRVAGDRLDFEGQRVFPFPFSIEEKFYLSCTLRKTWFLCVAYENHCHYFGGLSYIGIRNTENGKVLYAEKTISKRKKNVLYFKELTLI